MKTKKNIASQRSWAREQQREREQKQKKEKNVEGN